MRRIADASSARVAKSKPARALSTISGNGPIRRAITGMPSLNASMSTMPNVS
jgi:hypothetical protein